MTLVSSGEWRFEMVRRILLAVAALIWAGSAYAADVSLQMYGKLGARPRPLSRRGRVGQLGARFGLGRAPH